MKVLIVEDEIPAAEKLERYLHRYDTGIEVVAKTQSVEESTNWLEKHQFHIDLIFMDIQLTDGKSFEIFESVKIKTPIIFITAYDEFAIDAFKVNSIDYLLKPITYDDLSHSLNKFKQLKESLSDNDNNATLNQLQSALSQLKQKTYKTRFMVKLGEHIKSVTTQNIEFFYAEGRSVYLYNSDNRKFIIDYKLEELNDLLDPAMFYRVNRSFIVNIEGIQDVIVYSNSRLKIIPRLDFDKEIIVSRDKVAPFKEWLSGA
ncbi:response regulator transcription factor [Fulvivirga sp. RKSG066]|nr:response regulator transcription factor [Fulvivirga aurantia]